MCLVVCIIGRELECTNDLNTILIITGYNEVVRIPSGATNVDVRQHSYSGKPEDDNYLGKTSITLFQRNWHILIVFLHLHKY